MKRIGTVYFAIACAALTLMTTSMPSSAWATPHSRQEANFKPRHESNQPSYSPFYFFETHVQNQSADSWTIQGLHTQRDLRSAVLSLLDYVYENVRLYRADPNDPSIPRYNRAEHFGGWVRPEQGSCFNTRSFILVRDAVAGAKISFKNNGCMVVKGHWHDPYTDNEYKLANSMQVDHVVPLKHAYYSGGYRWSSARRCHYANYRSDRNHLLSVSAHENMSKSDKAPDRYMPPNTKFACRYLAGWLRIKAIWELTLSPEEVNAVQALSRENGCQEEDFKVAEDELLQERELSRAPIQKCLNFGSSQLPIDTEDSPTPDDAGSTTGGDPHDSWAQETFQKAG